MKTLILNHDEVVALLPMDECIAVMRRALSSLTLGEVEQPLRRIIKPSQAKGLIGLMPAYKATKPAAFGLKAICVMPDNPAQGKDAHQGAVMLFSGETGEVIALMNGSAITAIRTAAVSGVATDVLARTDASNLAIVGSSVQARTHLVAMSVARSIKQCRVVSRTPEHAEQFVEEMRERVSFPLGAVETVSDALENADLIVTATNVVEPIISREWISPGAHLNVVGSSFASAREVDSATIAASSLFVDCRESAVNEAGDYLFALKDGVIGPDHIRAELGEVITGQKLGRSSDEEITLFKSVGFAAEDLFAAEHVFNKAREMNVGTWVQF